MLVKLQDAFAKRRIPYYWNEGCNLLEKTNPDESKNNAFRINRMLQKVRNMIERDPCCIAAVICKLMLYISLCCISLKIS